MTNSEPEWPRWLCLDYYSCTYDETFYGGIEETWANYHGWNYAGVEKSAKNRFTNRKFKLRRGNDTIVACLDPGENRPTPGVFDWVYVGASDSRCP